MTLPVDTDDTIVALASAWGCSQQAKVRVSGPQVAEVLSASLRIPVARLQSRRAAVLSVDCWLSGLEREIGLDIFFWPGRRSYTRQPLAEVHGIGSPVIIDLLIQQMTRWGARLARPGEFTLRAFLAGRIDLSQAEAILGVIDAETERGARAALQQLAGGVAGKLHQAQEHLLNLLADVEAGLDFVDEDIEFVSTEQLAAGITSIRHTVGQALQQLRWRDRLAVERRVVIYGRPNAGKTSLFNALSGSRSNVADLSGTTTDFNSCLLEWDECGPLRLIDTAGVDPARLPAISSQTSHDRQTTSASTGQPTAQSSTTPDSIADRAQHHASEQIAAASLRLLCLDGSRQLDSWETSELQRPDPDRLVIWNKSDLPDVSDLPDLSGAPAAIDRPNIEYLPISSRTGSGLKTLRQRIGDIFEQAAPMDNAPSVSSQCVSSLEQADEALQAAQAAAAASVGDELVATELRNAADALGTVTGSVHVDNILDRIFSRFCIGK